MTGPSSSISRWSPFPGDESPSFRLQEVPDEVGFQDKALLVWKTGSFISEFREEELRKRIWYRGLIKSSPLAVVNSIEFFLWKVLEQTWK